MVSARRPLFVRHAKEIIGPYPSFTRLTLCKSGHPSWYLEKDPIAAVQGPASEGKFARCWAFRVFKNLPHYSRQQLRSTIYLCIYKIRLPHCSVGEQVLEDVGRITPYSLLAFQYRLLNSPSIVGLLETRQSHHRNILRFQS